MTALAVYGSRPVVAIDGQPDETLGFDGMSVLVEETTEGLYHCEARFLNFGIRPSGGAGYLYLGRDKLEFGKELAIELGAGERGGTVFRGHISALEVSYPQGGGGSLTVLAEDRLQDLRMKRRTRTFEDVTDEDVFSQIAGEHGLTPELDLRGPQYQVLAQVNQSDLAFLRGRARSIDAEVWVEGATLHASPRVDRGADPAVLEYGANLLSFTVRADLADQCTELGVGGWDVAGKAAIEETATESAISAELNGGTSGASILESTFAPRKERVVHAVPLTTDEARSLAEARFRERARRFITGTGLADGDARIRVGGVVDLSGLGKPFDGRYHVVRARQTYDSDYGFRTEFDVERPGLGPPER
jgi:uncharacterized protein